MKLQEVPLARWCEHYGFGACLVAERKKRRRSEAAAEPSPAAVQIALRAARDAREAVAARSAAGRETARRPGTGGGGTPVVPSVPPHAAQYSQSQVAAALAAAQVRPGAQAARPVAWASPSATGGPVTAPLGSSQSQSRLGSEGARRLSSEGAPVVPPAPLRTGRPADPPEEPSDESSDADDQKEEHVGSRAVARVRTLSGECRCWCR